MSLVMALPAGQDEHHHGHKHHQEPHYGHHASQGPVKDWKTEKDGRPARVNDDFKISLGVMGVCWVLGVAVFATELLWKQPELGLVQLDNLPDGDGSESLLIASTGIYYRPDKDTVWQGATAMFGSVRYLTDSNKGLPNYAADVAYALGGPRMILPGLLIAYAFGILLALFLAASTAVIAELVGPNFMHKHHHIYRPMLLKALAAFLAYGTALQMVALMVPWTIKSSVSDYKKGGSHIKAETYNGLWMLFIALFLHLTALTAVFHVIAKKRMHLRHPGWVIAVYDAERRRRHALKHQRHLTHHQDHAAKPPSAPGSTGSQETLVGAGDQHSFDSQGCQPAKAAAYAQPPQSFGDQPYAANGIDQNRNAFGSTGSVDGQPRLAETHGCGAGAASQYYSTSGSQATQDVPLAAEQGTYGVVQSHVQQQQQQDSLNAAYGGTASVNPLSIKKSRRNKDPAAGATLPQSLQPGGFVRPQSPTQGPPAEAPQGEAAAYYQNSMARSQRSKRSKAPPPAAPSTMDPFPKGNYSNMYRPEQ